MDKINKKILIIENNCEDFLKTRIFLCKYLISKGWNVFALIPNGNSIESIEKTGIKTFIYNFDRKNKGIYQLLKLIPIVRAICKSNEIHIVHSFRFQPNLLNVISNLFNKRTVILHITGLGIAYSNFSAKFFLMKILSDLIYQLKMIRANKIIVQNENDSKDILFSKFYSLKFHLIKGSGVDTDFFNPALINSLKIRQEFDFNDDDFICTCVTRLIWEKGIKEMVDAFDDGIYIGNKKAKLLIIGWSDDDNPRHVNKEYISKYNNNSNIFFLGKRNDVRNYLSITDVYLYPSYYREGIPRGILEALSMALPIITTNTPGCRLTVDTINKNGFLIKPKSAIEIKNAVYNAMVISNLKDYKNNSRNLALDNFSNKIIFAQIENIYSK